MSSYTAKDVVNESGKAKGKFLAAVFGVMGLALVFTALVAFGVSYFFNWRFTENGQITEEGANIMLWTLLGSLIFLLLFSIITGIAMRKTAGHGTLPIFIVYSAVMGIMLASLLYFGLSYEIVAEALGITALAFFGMFAVGFFSKRDMTWLGLIGIGLIVGGLLMSLFYGIWYLIAGSGAFTWLDVGVSFIILIGIMLLTAFDANRMGKIVSEGHVDTNLIIYCAYTMYCDFIAILFRVIYLLMATRNN